MGTVFIDDNKISEKYGFKRRWKMAKLKELTLKYLIDRSAVLYAENPCVSWVDEEPINYKKFYKQVKELQLFLQKKVF